MMNYGYARVSTDGQRLDVQLKQLRAAGAEKVFNETASGARSDRAQLRRVIGQLEKGDVLMVTRLDRLARLQSSPESSGWSYPILTTKSLRGFAAVVQSEQS
jgi:DNA invertase Pin-like site-specific DNA recombinase